MALDHRQKTHCTDEAALKWVAAKVTANEDEAENLARRLRTKLKKKTLLQFFDAVDDPTPSRR